MFVGAGDLNSGSHARTSPTDPSSQLHVVHGLRQVGQKKHRPKEGRTLTLGRKEKEARKEGRKERKNRGRIKSAVLVLNEFSHKANISSF